MKDGAKEIIDKLKEHGYAVVVVAPGNPTMMNLTKERFEKDIPVDTWLNTREMNLAKDDPELYESIAMEFNVALDECILFDDLEQVIKRASSLGLKTVFVGDGTSEYATKSVKTFFDLLH